jgi:predicted nucleic acid-binding protein
VAASVADHSHHNQAIATLELSQSGKIESYVSGHGLSEVYAVLTRTPFHPAVYPSEALKILQENILPYFKLVTITPQMYIETIRECADRGWIGGRIYDAIHLGCARESDCERIYTFNVRHFQLLAPDLAQCICAP